VLSWRRLAWLIPWIASAAAAQPPPSVALHRIPAGVDPPVLDGVLDDAAWQTAPSIGPLTQVLPIEGATPSERTDVRITYDSDFLYFGIRCHDREPQKLIARVMRRDNNLTSDDRVSLVLDTFHDHRNSFLFSTNPNSARWDAIIENNTRFRDEWNGIWYTKSRVDDGGWTAEMAIPFKTLSFDPEVHSWGFNILRAVRRRNETDRWASAKQNKSLIDMSEAGTLEGIRDIHQGLGLDVVPRMVLRRFWDRTEDRSWLRVKPGLDVFYKPIPTVTTALTVNNDFSDAPADLRQVNLSRFNLFFPETRQFFLRDAGIFDFGPFSNGNPNGLPFFSRRIGITDQGGDVDLKVGLKATGRIGPLNFGVQSSRMAAKGGVDASNLSVARAKLNFFEESSAGFIATHGNPSSNAANTLWGSDLRLRTSHFLGDQILELTPWFQQSRTAGAGSDEAFGARLSYPNDRWNGSFDWTRIGNHFDPALGFVNRTGIHDFRADGRRRWRPTGSWIRSFDVGGSARFVTDLGGDLQSRTLEAVLFRVENQQGDNLRLRLRSRREDLPESFEISDGVVLPADQFDWWRVVASFGTTSSRPLSVNVKLSAGTFFSGHLWSYEGSLGLRPSKHVFASISFLQNDVRLREGDFTTQVGRARFIFAFSPDVSWDTLFQWDNTSDSLGWNSRLRWIFTEGNELVLVWNQGVDTRGADFRFTRTELVGRLEWTFRF